MIPKVSGGVGILAMILAAVMSGVLTDGDRQRANFHTETPEDRAEKTTYALRLIVFAIPNILGAIIMFLILN
ncbi:DUF5316 domain-containing protein [Radiobacillus deserti]|uniref:DUF5316 domain-containing protein n=1 Tax=Radiobacillus deserti TaxID=2594883 RepID=UPI002B21F79A|nr:DUF5316 domain-containing protein [Radiobacillus deserti]